MNRAVLEGVPKIKKSFAPVVAVGGGVRLLSHAERGLPGIPQHCNGMRLFDFTAIFLDLQQTHQVLKKQQHRNALKCNAIGLFDETPLCKIYFSTHLHTLCCCWWEQRAALTSCIQQRLYFCAGK